MGLSEKLLEALRTGVVLNERVTQLGSKVETLAEDVRHLDRRLVRLETVVEIAKDRPPKLSSE